jgi:hypothetical protein
MKLLRMTLSKTEFELGDNGKLYYKVIKQEEFNDFDETDTKKPKWWHRLCELRSQKITFGECADILNAEGFRGNKGKPIRQNSLIVCWHYHTKEVSK